MDHAYRHLPNKTARERALAKDAGLAPSQIQRIIKGQVGASIDHIEWLSMALEVRPQDLLTPHFGQSVIARQRDSPMDITQQEAESAAGQIPAEASITKRDARTQGKAD